MQVSMAQGPNACRRGAIVSAALLALLAAGSLSGCWSPAPTPTPLPTPTPTPSPTPQPILIITSPEDGEVVSDSSIQVVGTAPPGAEIVLDLPLFGDRRTSADDTGDWVLTVDLEEGDNDLVFRIGADQATTKTIRIVYEPES
jgi:hypothetical protein